MTSAPYISDSLVQKAFDLLRSEHHAQMRAAYEISEKQLKVALAQAVRKSNAKTVTEREQEGLCSEEYADALAAHGHVAEAYFTAKDKREAAAAVIEGWRTQQSDNRAAHRAVA